MRISLSTKSFLLIMLAITILIVCIGLVNFLFLEDLYLGQKEDEYIELAQQFALDYDGNIPSSIDLIEKFENKYGINVVIADQLGIIQYTTVIKGNPWGGTTERWKNDNISLSHDVSESLKKGEITLYYTTNKIYENKILNVVSPLINNDILIFEVMIQPINESFLFFQRYYIFIGLGALLLGFAMAYLVSFETTMSISKINIMAKRMANSDFSVKYTDVHNDEIDEVGASLNILSEKLLKAQKQAEIYDLKIKDDIDREKKLERRRQQFISNVSHELKTPVSVIKSYANGLVNNLRIENTEAQYYCKVISEESDKMMELITELLEISKLDNEINTYETVNFDMISLVTGVYDRYKREMDQKGIKFELCKKEDCITVKGDPYRIEQVLVNFFTNAIKYTTNEKYIVVKIIRNDKKALIKIFNSGENIPVDEMSRIWDSFYRVDRSSDPERSGTGLGLYIVKKILRMHKSKFGVRNLKGGVEFWFDIDCF